MDRYEQYGRLDDRPIKDLESGFKGFNNRLRPDQLPTGVLEESLNGRCDIGGDWQTRKGIQSRLAPFTSPSFVLPFTLYANVTSSSLAGPSTGVITINFSSAHGIVDQTLVNVSGITGVTPDPNGNKIATVTSATALTISETGATGTAGGTATVGSGDLNDNDIVGVYGCMPFYDDANYNSSYILIAGNVAVTAFNLTTNVTTNIPYPTGVSVFQDVDMIQFDNKVYIHRDGFTAMEWDGDFTGSPAFTNVPNGDFTQPVSFSVTAFEITNNVGKVTVSTPSTHGLSVGDKVVLTSVGSSGLTKNDEFSVSEIGSSSIFFFNVTSPNLTSISDTKWTQAISQGMGFTHSPAPPFAIVHQKRLVVPFNYTMTGSSGSPTITDRKVRDELLFSLVSDSDVFDYIYGQFKFMSRKSDYLVGVHSFSDDQLVVLNRESIYVVSNSLDLKEAQTTLLSSDLGCIARSSIQQVADKLMFLSDNGVYALDFKDLYNLRGQDVPLSESINSSINRINQNAVENVQSVYFDNRYYMAAPIDGSSVNNAVFIFNFLNREWESIDTVDDPNWDYRYLIVAGDGDTRGVYAVNQNGGVHRLDSLDSGNDNIISQIGGVTSSPSINGVATTRAINGNDLDRKKWKLWDLHVESSTNSNSNATLSAITENIDATIALGSIESFHKGVLASGEDISIRGRFGPNRAYSIQFKFESTQGRPKIRAVKISGNKTFRSTNEAV